MKEHYDFKTSVVLAGAMIFLLATEIAYAGFIQLDGVADVKTRFSRGCSTLQEVAELARAKAIDTVIFGDQARDALEYGVVPLERIIRKRNESSSILTVGAPAYISEINDNDKQFNETLLISGIRKFSRKTRRPCLSLSINTCTLILVLANFSSLNKILFNPIWMS